MSRYARCTLLLIMLAVFVSVGLAKGITGVVAQKDFAITGIYGAGDKGGILHDERYQ